MTRHPFIPYPKSNDCPQCNLFPPICTSCEVLITTCKECNGRKNIIDHIITQKCDNCGVEKDCTFYEKLNKVICIPCAARVIREQGNVIDRERSDLALISSDKDFHNAHVMSLVELENGIKNDDSIPNSEKLFTFHKLLTERIGHYKETILGKRKEVQAIEKEMAEINLKAKIEEKTIRDYGNEVRKEIQELLREQDKLYQPEKPKVVKPAVGGKKKSPFEKMVETYAEAMGISKEKAKEMIEKGKAS